MPLVPAQAAPEAIVKALRPRDLDPECAPRPSNVAAEQQGQTESKQLHT